MGLIFSIRPASNLKAFWSALASFWKEFRPTKQQPSSDPLPNLRGCLSLFNSSRRLMSLAWPQEGITSPSSLKNGKKCLICTVSSWLCLNDWPGLLPQCINGLAMKKRTQKLCNSKVSCFGFQSQQANGSQANCAGACGCKRPR